MSSGYYAACAGLMSRTQALDTIANNLANVSTTGFRASHNVFGAVLAAETDSPLSALNQDANEYGILSGTQLDTAQGALVPTGNDLDLAIEGPGYFAVKTAGGPVYTRGGNFRVSPQGQLITPAGDPVLGDSGPISIVGEPVSISTDGTISVDGAIAGRLKVVEFPPGTAIESLGGSYYGAPAGADCCRHEFSGAPERDRELERQPGHQRDRIDFGSARCGDDAPCALHVQWRNGQNRGPGPAARELMQV